MEQAEVNGPNYRLFFEADSDGRLLVGTDEKIVDANPAACFIDLGTLAIAIDPAALIQDGAGWFISNDGGSFINNNGGTLISPDHSSGSFISQGGGNLVGKVK